MLFEILSEHAGSEQCKPEGIQINAIVYNISNVGLDSFVYSYFNRSSTFASNTKTLLLNNIIANLSINMSRSDLFNHSILLFHVDFADAIDYFLN